MQNSPAYIQNVNFKFFEGVWVYTAEGFPAPPDEMPQYTPTKTPPLPDFTEPEPSEAPEPEPSETPEPEPQDPPEPLPDHQHKIRVRSCLLPFPVVPK